MYSSLSCPVLILLLPLVTHASFSPHPFVPRAACNADNCLRALFNHATSASSFCSTYTTTTNTLTTSLPTYVPASCSPSRVSSACSCLVTPAPPSPCPTGQVLTNPDFYGCEPTYEDCGPMLSPWTINTLSGSPGCNLGNGYTYSNDGDPSAITCRFDSSTGGVSRIIHPLDLCPGHTYNLTAHLGFTDNSPPTSSSPTFKILVGTKTIVQAQNACGVGSKACELNEGGSWYRAVTAVVTGPTDGPDMQLIFEIAATGPAANTAQFLLLDTIDLFAV